MLKLTIAFIFGLIIGLVWGMGIRAIVHKGGATPPLRNNNVILAKAGK
jgi:hypothetical protein